MLLLARCGGRPAARAVRVGGGGSGGGPALAPEEAGAPGQLPTGPGHNAPQLACPKHTAPPRAPSSSAAASLRVARPPAAACRCAPCPAHALAAPSAGAAAAAEFSPDEVPEWVYMGKQRPVAQEDLDNNYRDVEAMNAVGKVGARCYLAISCHAGRAAVRLWAACALLA